MTDKKPRKSKSIVSTIKGLQVGPRSLPPGALLKSSKPAAPKGRK